MLKITFITTINHNVGDDFIREGIKYLLSKLNRPIEYEYIHKHSPITVVKGFERLRNYRISQLLEFILPILSNKDKILQADIVIQSGAPVYWCHSGKPEAHCADNEWYKPLIKKRLCKSKAKFFNIAAGSCQTWESNGKEVTKCPKCSKYIKELSSVSALTTLRDNIASQMLDSLKIAAPVIPCTSIFVSDLLNIKPENPEYLALNFMSGGGHYEFGQKIDYEKWDNEFTKFYNEIKDKEKTVFICHSKKELKTAKTKFPDSETFYSENYVDYIKFYAKVKYGIMNRIHGAFPIISFGRPAVIIGNDSRAKMAEVVGSHSYFVNDMNFEKLTEIYKWLKTGANDFENRFKIIKAQAEQDYLTIFTDSIL